MLSQVQRTIADRALLGPGDRVLIAVSGGPDSMALLHALTRLAARLGIGVQAATVDHGLRPESRGEAESVARWCADLGVACEVLPVDVASHRRAHVSLQDAARRAREAALAGAARRLGCNQVALGHTADDQAETILFRIVRGTGLGGLAGIPYRRGPIIRPLLDVRRAQVLQFLKRRQVSFVEDPSNRDPRFTRSRVRHEWLPFLARENPRIVEALLALGADSRRAGPPPALPPGPGRAAAARIAALAAQKAGTRWVSFRGGQAEVAYGQVTLRQPGRRGRTAGRGLPEQQQDGPAPMRLPGPGRYLWSVGGAQWVVEVRLIAGDSAPAAGAARFGVACLAGGLVLRGWRAGDRMQPRGARGRRKLADLFVDGKVPRGIRGHLPVLVTADDIILYVPGLRPAEQHRPGPDAGEGVEIRVTGPGAHLSCLKTDSDSARVDDLSLDDNTFSLGVGYDPRTS